MREDGVVRLGLVMTDGGRGMLRPFTRAPGATRGRTDLFCNALSVQTGLPIEPLELSRYRDLERALRRGMIDLLWAPPLVALHSVRRYGVLPLAVPIRGGVTNYYSALFTRVTSDLQQVSDLSGARAAWVDPASAAGYLVARAALRQRGVEPWLAFAEELFVGSHAEVARRVVTGDVDVGATFMDAPREGEPRRNAGWGRKAVRVLLEAGPIPNDLLLAAPTLPRTVMHAIDDALLHGTPEETARAALALFEAEGFAPATLDHIADLERALGSLDGAPFRPIE
jgi:phosphonate transport system substrate-binding protein